MTLYIENRKDSIRKLLELINRFSSFRIENQHSKSVAQAYPNKELSEKEIRKAIPFTIAPRRIKILRNKLN